MICLEKRAVFSTTGSIAFDSRAKGQTAVSIQGNAQEEMSPSDKEKQGHDIPL